MNIGNHVKSDWFFREVLVAILSDKVKLDKLKAVCSVICKELMQKLVDELMAKGETINEEVKGVLKEFCGVNFTKISRIKETPDVNQSPNINVQGPAFKSLLERQNSDSNMSFAPVSGSTPLTKQSDIKDSDIEIIGERKNLSVPQISYDANADALFLEETNRGNFQYKLSTSDIVNIAKCYYGWQGMMSKKSSRSLSQKVFFSAFPIESLQTNLTRYKEAEQQNKDLIFTAIINIGNSHWVTLVVARNLKNKFTAYYCDSFGNSFFTSPPKEVGNALTEVLEISNDFGVSSNKQQNDEHNCGIFALETAKIITDIMMKRVKNIEQARELFKPINIEISKYRLDIKKKRKEFADALKKSGQSSTLSKRDDNASLDNVKQYDASYGLQDLVNQTQAGRYAYQLQQADIANVARIKYGYFEDLRKDVFFCIPGNVDSLNERLKEFKNKVEQENSKKTFTSIINIGNYHWVTLVVTYEPTIKQFRAYYCDSSGIQLPGKIAEQIRENIKRAKEITQDLLIPVADGMSSLIREIKSNPSNVSIRKEKNDTVEILNSIREAKNELVNKSINTNYIVGVLQEYLGISGIRSSQAKQQVDTYNCGVFALVNAKEITDMLGTGKSFDEIDEKLKYKLDREALKKKREDFTEELLGDRLASSSIMDTPVPTPYSEDIEMEEDGVFSPNTPTTSVENLGESNKDNTNKNNSGQDKNANHNLNRGNEDHCSTTINKEVKMLQRQRQGLKGLKWAKAKANANAQLHEEKVIAFEMPSIAGYRDMSYGIYKDKLLMRYVLSYESLDFFHSPSNSREHSFNTEGGLDITLNQPMNLKLEEEDVQAKAINTYNEAIFSLKNGELDLAIDNLKNLAEDGMPHAQYAYAVVIFKDALKHSSNVQGSSMHPQMCIYDAVKFLHSTEVDDNLRPFNQFILAMLQLHDVGGYGGVVKSVTRKDTIQLFYEVLHATKDTNIKVNASGRLVDDGNLVKPGDSIEDDQRKINELAHIVRCAKYEIIRHKLSQEGPHRQRSLIDSILGELSEELLKGSTTSFRDLFRYGCAEMQFRYAVELLDEKLVTDKDKERAIKLLNSAIVKGHQEAKFLLGTLPLRGKFDFLVNSARRLEAKKYLDYLENYAKTTHNEVAVRIVANEYLISNSCIVKQDQEHAWSILRDSGYDNIREQELATQSSSERVSASGVSRLASGLDHFNFSSASSFNPNPQLTSTGNTTVLEGQQPSPRSVFGESNTSSIDGYGREVFDNAALRTPHSKKATSTHNSGTSSGYSSNIGSTQDLRGQPSATIIDSTVEAANHARGPRH